MSSAGVFMFLLGLGVIYQHKENINKPHYSTDHSYYGLATALSMAALMLVGAVGLHPDFGQIKTNQTVRKVHKTFGQLAIVLALWTMCTGLTA
jgi:hypothetical protein